MKSFVTIETEPNEVLARSLAEAQTEIERLRAGLKEIESLIWDGKQLRTGVMFSDLIAAIRALKDSK